MDNWLDRVNNELQACLETQQHQKGYQSENLQSSNPVHSNVCCRKLSDQSLLHPSSWMITSMLPLYHHQHCMVAGRKLFKDVLTKWHRWFIDVHIHTQMHVLCKYDHTVHIPYRRNISRLPVAHSTDRHCHVCVTHVSFRLWPAQNTVDLRQLNQQTSIEVTS